MSLPPRDAIELEVSKARHRHLPASLESDRSRGESVRDSASQAEVLPRVEDASDPVERLRDLLLEPRLRQVRQQGQDIESQIAEIERQLFDPDARREWVRSVLSSAIELEADRAADDLSYALAPIVAEAIAARVMQAPESFGRAIAPEIAVALQEQVRLQPDAIANAIAPEMGKAIKDQITIEPNVMVDALYPVIGSTISKYLAATLESINEKMEETLSVEGIKRKIRARIQGVSEAELLLRESVPFFIQNAFLIHKASGLVIAEVQQAEGAPLDSDMIAGMLTAIRSFVNEYIAQSGSMSELNDIKYGNAQVMLEVAGYCYLAVVVQGHPPQTFSREIGRTLSYIVQTHGDPIETYEGDPASVSPEVRTALEELRDRYAPTPETKPESSTRQGPSPLAIAVTALALVVAIWGGGRWLSARLSTKVESALFANPELSVYRLGADAKQGLFHPFGRVKLSGRVPEAYLSQKAEAIALTHMPERARLTNDVFAIETPANPVLAAAEVERVTATLNRQDGIHIESNLEAERLTVSGTVTDVADAEVITQTFARVPGVRYVTNVAVLAPLSLPTQIYFGAGTAQVSPNILESKLERVREFLDEYPETRLRVVGHSDSTGNPQDNERLALRRAQTVKYALELAGVSPARLDVVGVAAPPPGVDADQPHWLGRSVRFEPLRPLRAPALN